jgi:hypothetical protein
MRETDMRKKLVSITVPPRVQNLSSCVDRMQEQYNMKIIHMLQTNTCSILRQVEGILGLKALGVYNIPCECGAIYICETLYS